MPKRLDYALDLWSPAVWVAEELDRAAPAALSLDDLANHIEVAAPDISRIMQNEGCATERDARVWLVRHLCARLAGSNRAKPRVVAEDGGYRLADGVVMGDLRLERKKIVSRAPDSRHEQLFSLVTVNPIGAHYEPGNIRYVDKESDELRESMRQFGWVSQFPAIKDENGVTLVGHRRLRLAAELKIDPVWTTVRLGKGDEADADRLKIALVSNMGFKPMTPTDRKNLAVYLYRDHKWTIARIAEALRVHERTIERDLDKAEEEGENNFPHDAGNSPQVGPGRPQGSRKKKEPDNKPPSTDAIPSSPPPQPDEAQEVGEEPSEEFGGIGPTVEHEHEHEYKPRTIWQCECGDIKEDGDVRA